MKNKFLDYDIVQTFGDWEIVYQLAGAITSMAPSFKPRNFQEIIDAFVRKFQESDRVEQGIESYLITCSYNDLLNILKDILMQIPEFKALNLSTDEYNAGVNVDDPNRGKFCLISRYTLQDSSNDFIDLDACIQNVVNGLYRDNEIFELKEPI